MHTVHRVYIGARNIPSHKFLPNDENRITATLKKYLKGWNTTHSLGYWEGTNEETLILTVVQSPENTTNYGNGLVSAVGEIASFLDQYAIMWEEQRDSRHRGNEKEICHAMITLTAPTYQYLHDLPEMDGDFFYRRLKRFGREDFLMFGEKKKMIAQKVHAAMWRVIIAELVGRHEPKMNRWSRVVMEGYNGDDNHLDVRIRSDHGGGFKVTSGFWWCSSYYNYKEYTTDEVGPSYWDLYVPPVPKLTPMAFKNLLGELPKKQRRKIGRKIPKENTQ